MGTHTQTDTQAHTDRQTYADTHTHHTPHTTHHTPHTTHHTPHTTHHQVQHRPAVAAADPARRPRLVVPSSRRGFSTRPAAADYHLQSTVGCRYLLPKSDPRRAILEASSRPPADPEVSPEPV